jgi:hypothetical protein
MNLLVSNPAAGNAKGPDYWLKALARAGVKAEVMPAEIDNGEFRSALSGDDCLTVAGGDGTIRSYVAACLDSSCTPGYFGKNFPARLPQVHALGKDPGRFRGNSGRRSLTHQ